MVALFLLLRKMKSLHPRVRLVWKNKWSMELLELCFLMDQYLKGGFLMDKLFGLVDLFHQMDAIIKDF
jgi:hypothetical protein